MIYKIFVFNSFIFTKKVHLHLLTLIMAGIYIHIPFCKKACHYCNFHFSTTLNLKNELIDSLVSEIELRKSYFASEKIETIYFGGGTPSILELADLEKIVNAIYKNFQVAEKIELTFEIPPIILTRLRNRTMVWGDCPTALSLLIRYCIPITKIV